MRGVLKISLALAVLALLVGGLNACGGGDSDDSTATTTRESSAPANAGEQGSGKSADTATSKDDPSSEEGSAAFRTQGGDNSIQNYGKEVGGAEVDAVTAAIADYLQARADGDWDKQCALLSKATVAPLEQLASRTPQLKGKDCAEILELLTGKSPAAARVSTLDGDIDSLRVEGKRGFALYHGSDGVDYFVPLIKEDGEWKVGTLAPGEVP